MKRTLGLARSSCARVLIAAVATLAVKASVSRAEAPVRYGGQVVAGLPGAPTVVDPADATSPADVQWVELLFDTLYQLDQGGSVVPRLAAALPTTRDGTVWIPIRGGVVAHDGEPLTAVDAAASLEQLRTGRLAWLLGGVRTVTADGDEIRLDVSAPLPDLAQRLATPATAITRRRGGTVVGSGPFRLISFDAKRQLATLRAHDGSAMGRPLVDELRVSWFSRQDAEARRFETGVAHVSLSGATAFSGQSPKYQARQLDGSISALAFVGFGRRRGTVVVEPAFRRAVDAAIARGGLAVLGDGRAITPTRLPIPPGAGRATSANSEGDVSDARAQLERDLPEVMRKRSERLVVGFDSSRPLDREVSERVARALDKLGFAAVVTAYEPRDFRARADAGSMDLYVDHLAGFAAVPPLAMVAAFAAGRDPSAAREDAGDLTLLFRQRLPIVPLYWSASKAHVRTDVRAVGFDAHGSVRWADVFLWGAPRRGGARR